MQPVVTDYVAWSVSQSVCHSSEPGKNEWTDPDAVWVEDLGGPREPCTRWGSRSPMGKGKIFMGEGLPIVKFRDTLSSSVQKWLNQSRCWNLGFWAWISPRNHKLDGGPDCSWERSERCCTQLAANAGPKKVAKNRHLGTIPQLCRAISSQLRHVLTIRKTC